MTVEEKYRILRSATLRMIQVEDSLPALNAMADMAQTLGADEPTIGMLHALAITHEDAP